MDIKILVATHKKYWMPKDEVYLPIHVGKEGKEDLGYIGDNTGDNISIKNPNYCELTGLYWAWKNLDCEYIGLCHYRRYFAYKTRKHSLNAKKSVIYSSKDYIRLLKNYDIILPKATILNQSGKKEYATSHQLNDLIITKKILLKLYPEYEHSYNNVMNNNKFYFFNMFVMKKSLFNQYSNWLFPILFELEKQVNIKNYDSYQSRLFGFLSERLFNIWLNYQNLKIYESRITFLEGPTESKKIIYIKNLLNKIKKLIKE